MSRKSRISVVAALTAGVIVPLVLTTAPALAAIAPNGQIAYVAKETLIKSRSER